MTTNVDKLFNKLQDNGVKLVSIFPGTGNPTSEEVAGEILRILEDIEVNGLSEIDLD